MPQMAPLNWLTLMIFFMVIFSTFNIINFYSFTYQVKLDSKSKTLLSFSWKW